ncbi:MAG TPA: alpha/beta hydrolase [Polyangia bacterium]|jgi:pimeloyl-ACP methyl ester carboxylesterase|nr:alpha/beta hydrolase [Polyangia bacterium]
MTTFTHGGLVADYEARGDATAPTAILLHGLTVDRRILVHAFDEPLAQAGVRRLYVDLPGHGAAAGLASDASAASADALAALVAALARRELALPDSDALAAPLVIGYSYGGYLATALVRDLGGARGLFLCCPIVEPDFARRRQPHKRVAARDDDLAFSDDARERAAFDEVAVQQTRPLLAAFQTLVHPANIAVDAAVVAQVRARYALSRPLGDALTRLDAPATIVCGRDDHWAGWQDATTLVRQLPRVAFNVLPDCGHLLPIEQPDALHALTLEWLRRCA